MSMGSVYTTAQSQGAIEKEVSEIGSSLMNSKERADVLHQLLLRLNDRLTPVLSPSKPATNKSAPALQRECQISIAISEVISINQESIELVNDLIERLRC